jgi:hypothetical protein
MSSIVTSITTALWILIELIQFAYMAYLMWRDKNNVINRYHQRARTVAASA